MSSIKRQLRNEFKEKRFGIKGVINEYSENSEFEACNQHYQNQN